MDKLEIGQPSCYEMAYNDIGSQNLVITFTPTSGFFLYHNDLGANKLCVASTKPNYYLYNAGSACNKIVDFLKDKNIKNIICLGSSKAGLASILWAEILHRRLAKRDVKVFSLSFSPQTKLYPFNDNLYFPSYHLMWGVIQKDAGLMNCAINYGDLNKVLENSDLQGILIYPSGNPVDANEANYLQAKNIIKKPLNYPMHGSFLPFMPQAKDDDKLANMLDKLFENAKKDKDVAATIPESPQVLFDMIKALNVPTIEELCRAIFFKMTADREWATYQLVRETGFV